MEPNITIYVEKVNREERYILFDFVNKGEFDAVLEKLEYVCNRALRITESEEGSFQKVRNSGSRVMIKISDRATRCGRNRKYSPPSSRRN